MSAKEKEIPERCLSCLNESAPAQRVAGASQKGHQDAGDSKRNKGSDARGGRVVVECGIADIGLDTRAISVGKERYCDEAGLQGVPVMMSGI